MHKNEIIKMHKKYDSGFTEGRTRVLKLYSLWISPSSEQKQRKQNY